MECDDPYHCFYCSLEYIYFNSIEVDDITFCVKECPSYYNVRTDTNKLGEIEKYCMPDTES